VVVLDLMLPQVDGVEVCRRLRTFSDCYVLILTARSEEVDKLVGLGVGADDYVTKPFSPRELVARVAAMLRRPRAGQPEPVGGIPPRRFGQLEIDLCGRAVRVAGRPVELTRTEFEVLAALSSRPRMAFSRRQLIEAVWGPEWVGDAHTVDVHIGNLRRKLGDRRGTLMTTSRRVPALVGSSHPGRGTHRGRRSRRARQTVPLRVLRRTHRHPA
jgi:DNA-binding response OmpR family regulator